MKQEKACGERFQSPIDNEYKVCVRPSGHADHASHPWNESHVTIPKGEYEMLKHLASHHHPANDYIVRLAARIADAAQRQERYGEHIEELCHVFKTRDVKVPAEPTVSRIVAWLRGLSEYTREDWGLNASEEIADLLESGGWLEVPSSVSLPESEETEQECKRCGFVNCACLGGQKK